MSETIIDLRYLAESQPSLCIPRVFNNITEARIRQVFDEIGLGKISRIDLKERKNEKGDSFKRVYVHFEKWFWNEDAQAARRKLISGKEIKIVYDNPWFWKVSASKWAPSANLQDRDAPQRSRAHIEFDDATRTTDEFGRDLKLKKEYEERHKQDNYRERPARRPDERRRDDSRERSRPDNRRRPERRDDRKNTNTKCPIAPTLQRKAEIAKNPVIITPRTPDCSPPRIRPDSIDDAEEGPLKVDYGDIKIPPTKKRIIRAPKSLVVVEKVIEDGEVIETVEQFAGMTKEDKEACEMLYGDL